MSKWMLAILLVCVGPAQGQQRDATLMRLQVLSGKTGKPIVHAKVHISSEATKRLVEATTDGEGYVTVPETTPTPKVLTVMVDLFRACSRQNVNSFALQKVVATGVVSENSCKPRITLYPQAGTLVYFVRAETWLDRLRK